jgi:hypothetical protein
VARALGAISAGALTACGSDDEGTIPQASADSMLAALQSARDAEASGDCEGVQSAASGVSDEAAAQLPSDVPPDVRQAIIDGAEQLFRLAGESDACGGGDGREKTTTKATTTSTEETTTSTTEETTTTTAPPTTVPEQPPDEGGGNLGEGDSGGTPPNTGSGGTSG